jgi:hypothetical protein
LTTAGVGEWGPEYPQELHIDIRADDGGAAQAAVEALGVRRLPAEDEQGFWVVADPVGR